MGTGVESVVSPDLKVHGIEIALCRSEVFERGGMWYFFAEPAGYINGSHVTPELNTPQAFLAIREECYDRIRGLQAGGDDYLTKPTPSRVLIAHINRLVHRTGTLPSNASMNPLPAS